MRLFVTRPRQVLLAFRASRRLCRVLQFSKHGRSVAVKATDLYGCLMRKNGFSLLELLIVVAIILIIATIAIPSLLRSRQSAQESSAVAQLRTFNTAEVTYIASNAGAYGDIPSLITQGLLDARFSGSMSGYNFTVTVTTGDYTALATAVSSNAGRFDYFTKPDYVIRYATDSLRAPTGLSGEPVR